MMSTDRALSKLVACADIPFKLQDEPPIPRWDELDVTPSLLYEHSRFPRRIVHSNHVLLNILVPALVDLAGRIDANNAASQDLERILDWARIKSRYAQRRPVFDLLNSTSYMLNAYFYHINSMIGAEGVSQILDSKVLERCWVADGLGKLRWSDWSLIEPDIPKEGLKPRAKSLVNVELTTDVMTPREVFEGIASMSETSALVVDGRGRVIISDSTLRTRFSEDLADGVERWASQVWCQMVHKGVRFALLTSITHSLLFYVDDGVLQVTDVIYASSASIAEPCRSLLPLFLALTVLPPDAYRLPECYVGTDVERPAEPTIWQQATADAREDGASTPYFSVCGVPSGEIQDLSFGNLSSFSHLEAADETDSTGPEPFSPEKLGPPSLFVRLGEIWRSFDRLRREDVSHSLGKARRLPELFHGPISPGIIARGRLPIIQRPSSRSTTARATPPPRETVKSNPAVDTATPLDHFKPQIIELRDLLSFGAVWDVYRVHAIGPSPFPFPLVAKMICLDAFPLEVDPTQWFGPYSREGLSQDDIRVKASNELSALSALAEIPYIHTPRVIGLWGSLQGDKEVWVMVMEDVGGEVDVTALSMSEKVALVHQYECLHTAGILHNDCELRHWRRHSRPGSDESAGPVRIIDFDRALHRTSFTDEEWDERTSFEILLVRGMLGLGKTINSRYTPVADLRRMGTISPGDLQCYGLPDYAIQPVSIPEGEERELHEHHGRPREPRLKLLMTSWHELLLMELAKASDTSQSE